MAMASVNSLANSLCFIHGLQPLEYAYASLGKSRVPVCDPGHRCDRRLQGVLFAERRSAALFALETLLNLAGRLNRGGR